MARKKENSQKAAMKEMMRSYLKENDINIKNGTDGHHKEMDRPS